MIRRRRKRKVILDLFDALWWLSGDVVERDTNPLPPPYYSHGGYVARQPNLFAELVPW